MSPFHAQNRRGEVPLKSQSFRLAARVVEVEVTAEHLIKIDGGSSDSA